MPELCLSMEEVIAMGDAIAETAAIIDVATHGFLTQLRALDRLGAWHRAGAISCAHWLSWRIGLDLGAAREKVRVARRLADLPHIDQALRKGEISYSKVRAISRVATATAPSARFPPPKASNALITRAASSGSSRTWTDTIPSSVEC